MFKHVVQKKLAKRKYLKDRSQYSGINSKKINNIYNVHIMFILSLAVLKSDTILLEVSAFKAVLTSRAKVNLTYVLM